MSLWLDKYKGVICRYLEFLDYSYYYINKPRANRSKATGIHKKNDTMTSNGLYFSISGVKRIYRVRDLELNKRCYPQKLNSKSKLKSFHTQVYYGVLFYHSSTST